MKGLNVKLKRVFVFLVRLWVLFCVCSLFLALVNRYLVLTSVVTVSAIAVSAACLFFLEVSDRS
jgi:hypothetical protein